MDADWQVVDGLKVGERIASQAEGLVDGQAVELR
jgi:hypothetical protein